ncbi:MAG: phage holin family protein [Microbacterium sp.]|uniref:phage holin family protein n=1 Tax=Microbacterium sp. TaxID=51671 RepID=UPI0039E7248A
MTTTRGVRDRADDSLFTLIGDVPELVRNLVVAEVNAAKKWAAKTAKDAGIGAGWMLVALFFVFWSLPALGVFLIWGFHEWWGWPVWAGGLTIFGAAIVAALVFVLLGILRFKRLSSRENPGQAIAHDVNIVKGVGDEF